MSYFALLINWAAEKSGESELLLAFPVEEMGFLWLPGDLPDWSSGKAAHSEFLFRRFLAGLKEVVDRVDGHYFQEQWYASDGQVHADVSNS